MIVPKTKSYVWSVFRLTLDLLRTVQGRGVFVLTLTTSVLADSPTTIEKLSSQGEFYKAMVSFEQLSKRARTPKALIAAGKSAWALSLPKLAVERLEEALLVADREGYQIPNQERARVIFYRAIIEFQEDNFNSAYAYSGRSLELLDAPSNLRGKVLLLQGESLVRQGQCGPAERILEQSYIEIGNSEKPNAAIVLAKCQIALARYESAENTLISIPADHERAGEGIRLMAELYLDQKRDREAGEWLLKGRELFPEQFLDSWVDYGLVRAAVDLFDKDLVAQRQKDAIARHPASDYWVTLLDAIAEGFFARGVE